MESTISSLRLRPIAPDDAPALYSCLKGDTELALQTSSFPIPYTIESAREFISKADPENIFAVTVNGELVGTIGFIKEEKEPVEIGYWISRACWSRGYATSAISLLVEEARGRGLSRLAGDVFPGNTGSMRVLEKNGFVRVGEIQKDVPKRGGLRTLIRFERTLET